MITLPLPPVRTARLLLRLMGGVGSGYHGHAGRPGKVGGSAPSDSLPPAPGTTPIPEGMVRGYHFTDNLDSVLKVGIDAKYARGNTYGEPNVIWFSTTKPRDIKDYVEVFVRPDEIGLNGPDQYPTDFSTGKYKTTAQLQAELDDYNKGDHDFALSIDHVSPERFVTYHRPWHDDARYLVKEYPFTDAAKVAEGRAWIKENRQFFESGTNSDQLKAIDWWLAHAPSEKQTQLGGVGSGNFQHRGRPGQVGGSGAGRPALKHEQIVGRAANWVHRYMWLPGEPSMMPSPQVESYLKRFRPTKPVELYRFERKDFDPMQREVNKNLIVQSWTHNAEMAKTIAEMNSELFQKRTFQPKEIFTDFTMFPDELKAALKKLGSEEAMQEVLVYHFPFVYTKTGYQRAAGDYVGHPFRGNQWKNIPRAFKMLRVTERPEETRFLLSDGTRMTGQSGDLQPHEKMLSLTGERFYNTLRKHGVVRYVPYVGVETSTPFTDKQVRTIVDDWQVEYGMSLSVDVVDERGLRIESRAFDGDYTYEAVQNFVNQTLKKKRELGDYVGHPFHGNQWTDVLTYPPDVGSGVGSRRKKDWSRSPRALPDGPFIADDNFDLRDVRGKRRFVFQTRNETFVLGRKGDDADFVTHAEEWDNVNESQWSHLKGLERTIKRNAVSRQFDEASRGWIRDGEIAFETPLGPEDLGFDLQALQWFLKHGATKNTRVWSGSQRGQRMIDLFPSLFRRALGDRPGHPFRGNQWWHGTSSEHVKDILKNGILRSKSGATFDEARPNLVYVTKTARAAQNWAQLHTIHDALEPNGEYDIPKNKSVIVKVQIPKTMAKDVVHDVNFNEDSDSFQFPHDIKPEWIKEIWEQKDLTPPTGTWVRTAEEADEDTETLYLVVMIPVDEKRELGDKPGHPFHGNQWTDGRGYDAPGLNPDGTVTLLHGTTKLNADAILQNGFKPGEPKQIADYLEKKYDLPQGSIWNNEAFSFARHRRDQDKVHLTADADVAKQYALPEVVQDALMAAWMIKNPDVEDTSDPRWKTRGEWIKSEGAKLAEPDLLAVTVPFDVVGQHGFGNKLTRERFDEIGLTIDDLNNVAIPHNVLNENAIVRRARRDLRALGDKPGHPFHGNQYTDVVVSKSDTLIEAREAVADAVRAVQEDFGIDIPKINVVDKEARSFEVGDRMFTEGGHYDPTTGEIEINARYVSDPSAARIMVSHEVTHAVWQQLRDEQAREHEEITSLVPDEYNALFQNNGYVRPDKIAEVRTRWPVSNLFYNYVGDAFLETEEDQKVIGDVTRQSSFMQKMDRLRKNDGVTDYSAAYWQPKALDKMDGTERAINETLAEIAAIRYGKIALSGVYRKTIWSDFYNDMRKLRRDIEDAAPRS